MPDKKTNIETKYKETAVEAITPTQATDPPINLDAPLRWKKANSREQKMLRNLQGNILKGHGRDHTWNIFLSFGKDQAASRRFLREIGNFYLTDAYKQLLETEAFKKDKTPGGTFCSAFLSASGYEAIGLKPVFPEGNKAFSQGMKSKESRGDLTDPDLIEWEKQFQKDIHCMILIADDDTDRGSKTTAKIHSLLKDISAEIHLIQVGKAIRNAAGNGLEHFGYIDGRSQPLLLMEDIDKESRDEGLAHWNPAFPLSAALVRDPLHPAPSDKDSEDAEAFGSFFIFRKLEQNVAGFKSAEQDLADALGLKGKERERAGAFVVGRFEDGTPVTMSSDSKGRKNPANDFDYSADPNASRCPFHAHIRKTNPRGSGGFETEPNERSHIMPRRGIPYEDKPREIHPDGLPHVSNHEDFKKKVLHLLPEDGVGLLFMAYNSKLDDQFVFTQQSWANSRKFPKRPDGKLAGTDGVIGQISDATSHGQEYPKIWDDAKSIVSPPCEFEGFVTMKGGEYFFAPSVLFFRSL